MKNLLRSALLVSVFSLALAGGKAQAIEAFYVGGEVGHVGLSGAAATPYSNTIGFAIDLGARVNPMLDLMFQFMRSSHSGAGGLTIYGQTVSADFHFFEMNDFDLSIGGGPGFYFMNSGTSSSFFGLNGGANIDVIVDDHVRVGLGFKYHGVFGAGSPDFWTTMMRVGYLFESN